jgi:hypothetical protein
MSALYELGVQPPAWWVVGIMTGRLEEELKEKVEQKERTAQ